MRKDKIAIYLSIAITVVFLFSSRIAKADCSTSPTGPYAPGIPHCATCTPSPAGDYTLTQDCIFNGSVNGVDGGNIFLNGKTLHVLDDQTLVFNPSPSVGVTGKTINNTNAAHGQIIISKTAGHKGQIKKTNLWMLDTAGTGYPDDMTQVAADGSPGGGYVRRSALYQFSGAYTLLQAVVDCVHATAGFDTSKCSGVTTDDYSNSITSGDINSVSVAGHVNPNGYSTSYLVRYWTAGSAPSSCTSNGGVTTGWIGLVNGAGSPITTGNTSIDPITLSVNPGTAYKYCVIAINSYGIAFGDLKSFTTVPTIQTDFPSMQVNDPSAVTLNGEVTPNGTSTSGRFFYTSDGSSPSCPQGQPTNAALTGTASGYQGPWSDSSGSHPYSYNIPLDYPAGTVIKYCATASNRATSWTGGANLYSFGQVLSYTVPYQLSVSKSGSGTVTSPANSSPYYSPSYINCGTACFAYFPPGSVTLTAAASAGYRFDSWSGCDSLTSDSPPKCNVNISGNKSVSVIFIQQHVLTVAYSSSGWVNGPGGILCGNTYDSGSGSYIPSTNCQASLDVGTSATLYENTDPGNVFTGWSGCDSLTNDSPPRCNVTMNLDKSVTASYSPYCNAGPSCSGSCSATANTCSANNGAQSGCNYTTYSGGGSCTQTAAPNQPCTVNNCSSGYTCSGGSCVLPSCNSGTTCGACGGAASNTCNASNGTQSCTYTTYTGGGACNQVSAPSQSCTVNNCSSGYTCSGGSCVLRGSQCNANGGACTSSRVCNNAGGTSGTPNDCGGAQVCCY